MTMLCPCLCLPSLSLPASLYILPASWHPAEERLRRGIRTKLRLQPLIRALQQRQLLLQICQLLHLSAGLQRRALLLRRHVLGGRCMHARGGAHNSVIRTAATANTTAHWPAPTSSSSARRRRERLSSQSGQLAVLRCICLLQ